MLPFDYSVGQPRFFRLISKENRQKTQSNLVNPATLIKAFWIIKSRSCSIALNNGLILFINIEHVMILKFRM